MTVISFEIMINALKRVLEGVDDRTIKDYTEILLGFFGYGEYLVDNILSKEERNLFYHFEEKGLLKTKIEEITLSRGKLWRIHYWVLNTEKILTILREKESSPEEIYKKLFETEKNI